MEFDYSDEQLQIKRGIKNIAENYDDIYWREHHDPKVFPKEFWSELSEGGWIAPHIPKEYGGMGLGIFEASLIIEELAKHGAWRLHGPISRTSLGASAILEFGNDLQKNKLLEDTARGQLHWCQAFTEADAGLNISNTSTTAKKCKDGWILNGQKMWIGGAKRADFAILLARINPESMDSKPDLALFILPMEKSGITLNEIKVDGYFPTPVYEFNINEINLSNKMLLFRGKGGDFSDIFNVLNHERITFSAFNVGCGYHAIQLATDYANNREVFNAPIGSHQAIQHPLADAYSDLEIASIYVKRAAWLYDHDEKSGITANIAMLKSAEAAWKACEAAMDTFGGSSIATEIGISALWQTVRHQRIIPVTEQMILNYIGEHALDLPKSY